MQHVSSNLRFRLHCATVRGMGQISQKSQMLWLGLISQCKLVEEYFEGSWVLLERVHHFGHLFLSTPVPRLLLLCGAFVSIELSRYLRKVTYCLKMSHC
jgi:hypothetical protein